MQSATRIITNCDRFITNCDGTCTWSTLKFWSTHFKPFQFPLTSLTSYTRKLICIFTFFESLIIHSVCSQICISSCFQKLFRKYSILPIVYAERGANSVLWGTQIIASYVSAILTNFYRKWTKTERKSSSSEAEPAITCNRKFTQSTLTSTKRNNSSILSLSTCK